MNDSPYIINILSAEQFEREVLEKSHSVPVLVDYWASWCQPCQILIPLLSKLAQEYQGAFILAKVNTEEQQALATAARVRNLPTVRLYKNGQIIDEFMGAKPEGELRSFLEQYIVSQTDQLIAEAAALSQGGRHEEAITLLKNMNEQDPGNANIVIAIAKAYLQAKELDNCEAVLNALPAQLKSETEVKNIRASLDIALSTQDAPPLDELESRLQETPEDQQLRLQLANQYLVSNHYEKALENLMFILSKDMNYQEGMVKKTMLHTFETLGNQHELVKRYRKRLASLLY